METRDLWERTVGTSRDLPEVKTLLDFLETRFRTLELLKGASSNDTNSSNNKFKKETRSFHVRKSPTCLLCNQPHVLRQCQQFLSMDQQARKNFVLTKPLCLNCFAFSHPTQGCNSPKSCYHCGQRHHTLLHAETLPKTTEFSLKGTQSNSNLYLNPNNSEQRLTTLLADNAQHSSSVLLATALIKVITTTGIHTLRALIDPGSQGSFITENVAQKLQLRKYNTSVRITGLGTSSAGISTHQVKFKMQSFYYENFACDVNAYVLKSITTLHPTECVNVTSSWHHINGLPLADPTFNTPGRIDVLLGVDVYPYILIEGLKRSDACAPTAQNTYLGWILLGNIQEFDDKCNPTRGINLTSHHSCVETENLLRLFWELEDIQENNRKLTEEEQKCEEYYDKTHCRLKNGRYQVSLPFKELKQPLLGESRNAALLRLYSMERKLSKDIDTYKQYSACLNEYLSLSHMRPAVTLEREHITKPSEVDSGYTINYLPHHAVFKDSSTTQLRVVFDASHRTTNGLSLNDTLLTGPKLQEDIISVMMRWRKHRIAFSADITQMYRQIRVTESDTVYQRIIWRDSPSAPIKEYDLMTVTFGTSCAPYLAIRTLRQLAEDEKDNFPLAYPVVFNEMYVDDVMSGADSEVNAMEVQRQLRDMLSSGGFELRKWASNSSQLVECVPENQREKRVSLNLDEDGFIKALGLYWHPKNDCFIFNTSVKEKSGILTKRNLLSQIAQLYDPIGWLTPTVIMAKIMIQQLWLEGMAWDDPVPENIVQQWQKLKFELKLLESLEIPRWLGTQQTVKSVQLHGFCDASTSAYCAVVYVRVADEQGDVRISLLISKSKVAPVKPTTLPRLELCGAVLLAKLIHKVKITLGLNKVEVFNWCDSMITLSWIRGNPNKWKTFVCNRVALIQEYTDCSSWRYVNTNDNPADYGSRGCLPSTLVKITSWWQGPSWLRLSENEWPSYNSTATNSTETDVEKRVKVHHIAISQDILIEDFSTLPRLLKVTALCFRFIKKCRRITNRGKDVLLEADEVCSALSFWIKTAQSQVFQREISDIRLRKTVHSKSSLLSLTPFICENGLLRVGGRLQNSKLNYSERHPIILPTRHHLTYLIVKQAHLVTLHGGPQLMLAYLRRTYWISHARNMIRKVIHQCLTCFRYKRTTASQIMGNLPEPRVNISRAFMHTGVDYAGPISVRMSKGRGAKVSKGYIAIFICLSTKAVHLEPVSDQTTQAFLAAFRRFVSRRGMCSDLYSDCGTNFIGASKIMQDDYTQVLRNIPKEAAVTLAIQNVRWHFIPPASPHFGGLWEAGVKSLKHHFRRVTGDTSLTFEELATLLAQIEACLNSRPLCPLSDDPADFSILTPGHFLIGDTLLAPPETDVLNVKLHSLTRWQYLQRLKQQFWKMWTREYIPRLQQRPKWTGQQKNIDIGNMVLIKDERLPPMQWLLGRVEEVFPGKDGLVRVVAIRTKTGILKRPITKIALLPIAENFAE